MMDYVVHLSFSLIVTVILGCLETWSVAGTVILSPMDIAPVCQVGDPLQLTCTASVEFVRWNILQMNEHGTLVNIINDRKINSRDQNYTARSVMLHSVTFLFQRISPQFAMPFISRLSIESVNLDINGTVVHCSNNSITHPMTSATTIKIIDRSQNLQYAPMLSVSVVKYEADNVTVNVEWDRQVDVTYTLCVSPLAPVVVTGSTGRQLTISYNTEYNVTVEASTPCRPNDKAFIVLNYGNCGDPELLLTAINHSVPKIVEHDNLPVEGSTITFVCPSGLVLTGSDSATCTKNGEWEPDPGDIMCNDSKAFEFVEETNPLTLIIAISTPMAVLFIIICITVTVVMTAVVVLKLNKKESYERRSHVDLCTGEVQIRDINANHQEQHYQQDALIYADVSVASKENKRKKKPQTHALIKSNDLTVHYSAVDHNETRARSNFKEVEMKKESNSSPSVDLDKLVFLLREHLSSRWYEFGEIVGIDDVVLDSIAKTSFSQNCIAEVLDYWLKYSDERLTWKSVIDVLKEIDLHNLAQDIEQMCDAGEFTFEADTYENETPLAMVQCFHSSKKSMQTATKIQQRSACSGSNSINHQRKIPKFPPSMTLKPRTDTSTNVKSTQM